MSKSNNTRARIKRAFFDAIGKEPDYWVTFATQAWCEKGVLTEGDLEEIDALIEAKNAKAVDEVRDETAGI